MEVPEGWEVPFGFNKVGPYDRGPISRIGFSHSRQTHVFSAMYMGPITPIITIGSGPTLEEVPFDP